jgi:hypothetical protein
MKFYCVVYKVYGIIYRFRCNANTPRQAKKECCECMGVELKDIVDVYEE